MKKTGIDNDFLLSELDSVLFLLKSIREYLMNNKHDLGSYLTLHTSWKNNLKKFSVGEVDESVIIGYLGEFKREIISYLNSIGGIDTIQHTLPSFVKLPREEVSVIDANKKQR